MRIFLLTSLTMMAFAANSVLTRAGIYDAGLDAVWFGVIRLWSGALVLLVLVAALGNVGHWRSELRLASLLGLFLYIFGFSLAYVRLESGLGALILFGMVQVTMFSGSLLGGERPPMLRWIGTGIAFGGLVYVLAPGSDAAAQSVNLSASLLMIVAGIGWGIYSLKGRQSKDPLLSTAVNFSLVAPIGLLFALAAPAFAPAKFPPNGVLLAVVSGAVTSGLGYALWYAVLPRLAGSVASVAQLTVPIIAMAGGAVFLGEALTVQFAVASLLVLGGVGLSLVKR
ncbi:MAG: DMT family transporter [Pelagimonas sp.]|jgi:drug/metabolite transporter (DMT)-like permease|nr:DMT family transporter [Pelagimonas sp.]